jgi:purine-nucleoside/S-methyl-5'-thioadenosine phosphorylase / adenosine deaminase
LFRLDNSHVYRAEKLEQFPWLEHGFGTRLSAGWPIPQTLATAKQIHSDQVLLATHPGNFGPGDALISGQPGVTVSIRTADCLPVVIVDPRTRAVAAVHAGWRGVVAEIVPKALKAMAAEFGSRPEDLEIAIGPGIGPCCFEVGPEVGVQFQAFFPERNDLEGRAKIDLVETITRQLRRNGVTMGQISSAGLCSCCNPELFESYRRDRDRAGRMIAAAGVRTAEPPTH